MAKKTKAEREALAEAQRRQNTSVTDLAKEAGMVGNRPAGRTVDTSKKDS